MPYSFLLFCATFGRCYFIRIIRWCNFSSKRIDSMKWKKKSVQTPHPLYHRLSLFHCFGILHFIRFLTWSFFWSECMSAYFTPYSNSIGKVLDDNLLYYLSVLFFRFYVFFLVLESIVLASLSCRISSVFVPFRIAFLIIFLFCCCNK